MGIGYERPDSRGKGPGLTTSLELRRLRNWVRLEEGWITALGTQNRVGYAERSPTPHYFSSTIHRRLLAGWAGRKFSGRPVDSGTASFCPVKD